jgi:DNA-binding IclR family transcriptional regulator
MANQSIHRAAIVLRAVAEAPSGIRVSELARSVSLAYPTVTRIVQTLERERFLARAPGARSVVLGPDFVRLAQRFVPHTELLGFGKPHVEVLALELGEAVELSAVVDSQAPDLDRAIHVLVRVETAHVLRTGSTSGRGPLHATSVGKILLAHRPDAALNQLLKTPLEAVASGTITDPSFLLRQVRAARRSGFAEAVDELEQGVSALSTGIHDRSGVLVGILNVDGPTARFARQRRKLIAAMMLRATAVIEADVRDREGATFQAR